jgi:F-box protein 21
MVFPNGSEDLDGRSVAAESNHADPMYLDPWRSDAEVPASHLREILSSWGIQPVDFAKYISDTPVSSLVLRTSKNILATVHEFRLSGANITDNEHPTIRLYANPFADLDNSFYSALWANFLLSDSETDSDAITQHQFVPMLLEKFERFYPMDASLIEQYVCPLFDSTSGAHWQLYEALRIVRAVDQSPKQIKPRDSEAAKAKIKYKVGQVFRHKRYRYIAVITGWDIECGMSSAWIEHNQVDDLSGGRHQSFYHSL